MPDEIANAQLDQVLPPESSTMIVDADSTQIRALLATERGHNLVIEGPPGTGKSQTITNLIARTLDAGKSVLFVAEKQAALNVVFDRLKKQGFGDFCFELHSSKANKSAVISELRRSIDASGQQVATPPFQPTSFKQVREELSEYVNAIHLPRQPLGISVYQALGKLLQVRHAPETRAEISTDQADQIAFNAALSDIRALVACVAQLGAPRAHPWFNNKAIRLTLDGARALSHHLRRGADALQQVKEAAQQFSHQRILDGHTLGIVDDLTELLLLIEQMPVRAERLADMPDFASRIPTIEGAITRGRIRNELQKKIQDVIDSTKLTDQHQSAVECVQKRSTKSMAWIHRDWWQARAILRSVIVKSAWRGTADAASIARDGFLLRASEQWFNDQPALADILGDRWKGIASDWDELSQAIGWVARIQSVATKLGLSQPLSLVLPNESPLLTSLRLCHHALGEFRTIWRSLIALISWPSAFGEDLELKKVFMRFDAMAQAPDGWREFAEFIAQYSKVHHGIGRSIAKLGLNGELPWESLADAFAKRFYELWLENVIGSSAILKNFSGASHQQRIEQFCALDREALEWHRSRLLNKLRSKVQEKLRDPSIKDDVDFLRGQMARQRGFRPVRQLLERSYGAIRAMKPCFLMSPATVALCLDPGKHRFDLVVFDEASQLPPEDALGTIARGDQIVVVGDPKQLPPTNFFAVITEQVSDSVDGFDDCDSVLELAAASGFASSRLRWHYRSRHESLIAFSNRKFYESSLFTFPSSDLDTSVRGIQFDFVENGVYEGAGVNRKEAERVVHHVIQHMRTTPHKTLCVGTLNLAQQLAIQDELELRQQEDPELDAFLSAERSEPFFVKNLENIQGDERDVVILSITYGRDVHGRVRANFGPINGPNGWRRLNVLTTRARERMLVVSSMKAEHIDISGSTSRGPALLRDFLDYAATGRLDGGPTISPDAATESPFEQLVKTELENAGVLVQPQVGVAGYRIDFGIKDPTVPGRFVCGIECDGASYHASESARDRDRLREEVLRRLGWKLHRVWSTDWWFDPRKQTARLVALIEQSKIEAQQAEVSESKTAQATVDTHQLTLQTTASESKKTEVGPVQFAPYKRAQIAPIGRSIHESTDDLVASVFEMAVIGESPIHISDVQRLVLQAFGHTRIGAKLIQRLRTAERIVLEKKFSVTVDGNWWYSSNPYIAPRSRMAIDIPPDRIAPLEYDAAVIHVLRHLGTLSEQGICSAVKDGFGYPTATTPLVKQVNASIQRLMQAGKLGLASTGLTLLNRSAV